MEKEMRFGGQCAVYKPRVSPRISILIHNNSTISLHKMARLLNRLCYLWSSVPNLMIERSLHGMINFFPLSWWNIIIRDISKFGYKLNLWTLIWFALLMKVKTTLENYLCEIAVKWFKILSNNYLTFFSVIRTRLVPIGRYFANNLRCAILRITQMTALNSSEKPNCVAIIRIKLK